MPSTKVGGEQMREARALGLSPRPLLLPLRLLQVRHTLALPAHADSGHDEGANEVDVGRCRQNPEQN